MSEKEYEDDYEGEIDLEEAGYLEDAEDEDTFEKAYDSIFERDDEVEADVGRVEYDHDAVTGRKAKRPKLSALNKSRLSKQELDELFLD